MPIVISTLNLTVFTNSMIMGSKLSMGFL